MKRVLILFLGLALFAPVGLGCHTVQGAGEDIKTAGEKSQETIDPGGQRPSDNLH